MSKNQGKQSPKGPKVWFQMSRPGLPWLIWVYLVLVLIFVGMALIGAILPMLVREDHRFEELKRIGAMDQFTQLMKIGGDGLKVALGALLGSLSMAARVFFERPTIVPKPEDPRQ